MSTQNATDLLADLIADAVVAKLEARQRAAGQRVMATKDAAQYLGMSKDALRRRSKAGDIPNIRDGRDLRFDRVDLDLWIAKRSGRG